MDTLTLTAGYIQQHHLKLGKLLKNIIVFLLYISSLQNIVILFLNICKMCFFGENVPSDISFYVDLQQIRETQVKQTIHIAPDGLDYDGVEN